MVNSRSTVEKKSFHIIHANPTLLFENNQTLGMFLKVIIHRLLYLIITHKCLSFNIKMNTEKYTINELITLISPYINIFRTECTQCILHSYYISVSEASHLLISNKHKQLTLAIDLHVYSKNQQFRLYDSIKKGKNNPLITTMNFPFDENTKHSYFDILQKSIVSHTEQKNVPIIYEQNKQFITNTNNTTTSFIYSTSIINHIIIINTYMNTYYKFNDVHACILELNKLNSSTKYNDKHHYTNDNQIKQFIPFVQKLIQSDLDHQGYIVSCIRGNYNKDLLFFNIGGNYRYCPQIGTHHHSNSTAIIIDTNNNTYAIRCKDHDCNNKACIWNKIK